MTRKSMLIVAMTLVAILLTATVAFAANPHFVGQPQVTDNGTTVTASGSIAGLGNENITVVVEAQGTAIVDCRNPGGNIAPGQRTQTTVTGSQENIEVKNGRANFTVTTAAPTPPSAAVVCPNAKWTVILRDVEFTSATITVIQGGQTVLTQNFDL